MASVTSKVKFDLIFVIKNIDYPGIHVHIASNSLRGHGDLLMTSEVILTSDLKSATLNTLVSMCILPPTASEAMMASEAMAASNCLGGHIQPWI